MIFLCRGVRKAFQYGFKIDKSSWGLFAELVYLAILSKDLVLIKVNARSCVTRVWISLSIFKSVLEPYSNVKHCCTFPRVIDPEEYLSGVVKHACVCLALSGLSVMLFINQQEYIGVLSQSAGIRFLVHRRDHYPFLEEEGQNAGPGTLSAVKLTLVNMKVCITYTH